MAIYRSDQAQFTFAVEAGQGGGPPEAANGTALGTSHTLSGVHLPGTRLLTLNASAAATFVASNTSGSDVDKRFVLIDQTAALTNQVDSGSHPSVPEVRRVTRVDGVNIYVDPPIAFPHANGAVVRAMDYSGGISAHAGDAEVSDYGGVDIDKFITWFPGVYETVDCPDPEEAFDQRYVLGQNTNRNVYQYFKGQQTYSGSVAGMVLLNGHPLRFPIGKVVTIPTTAPAAVANAAISANKGAFGKAGSPMIKLVTSSAVNIPNGTILCIGADNGAVVINGTTVPSANNRMEIRRVVAGGSASEIDGSYLRLNYPLKYDHDPATPAANGVETGALGTVAATGVTFVHHIIEDVALPSVSWNVNIKDDAGENAFQRRYYGGKIDGLTISAEAGGLITCDWDTSTFLGMNHNIAGGDALLESSENVRGYTFMQDIAKTDIGTPVIAAGDGKALPSTEPYYFSEGTIKVFGSDIGRIQNFSLNVSNALEPKYYIEHRGGDNRGPNEVKEGQRTYGLTATVGLPDSSDFTSLASHSLFKELLQAGDHPTASN